MSEKVELARTDGENISGIRALNDSEVHEIRACNTSVFDFNRHFKLVEYVSYNYDCLKDHIESNLIEFSEDQNNLGNYDIDRLSHGVNILLLNFMMSVRTFLDHMETHVKRTYGKISCETDLLKNLTSTEFDSKFSYRFMYKLRNYVQHCGMPPINYTKTKVLKGDNPRASIVAEFDRNALLFGFDSWGAKVKPDLEALGNNFSVFDTIYEFYWSILSVYVRFTDATTFPATLNAKARILEIIEQPESYRKDDYCLLNIHDRGEGKIDLNMSWVPASLFQKIDQYLSIKNEI